jgi:hypothetical protein
MIAELSATPSHPKASKRAIMAAASVAAQVVISVIPIVAIVMGCVVIFFYLLWSHREKVLLIKEGSYSRPAVDIDTFSLLAGLLLSCVGLVLTVLFVAIEGLSYSLFGGIIPLALGIGLLVFYGVRSRKAAA